MQSNGSPSEPQNSFLPPSTPSNNGVTGNTPSRQAAASIEVVQRVSVSAIAELIDNFDGDNEKFESWVQKLTLVRRSYKQNDDYMRIGVSSELKSKAAKWFHSRPQHLDMTIDELVGELRKVLFSPLSKLDLRKKFENRVWSSTESFSEYLYDKVIFANKVKIDDSELVDYLIEGIQGESLRDQAKMQRFENKDALFKAFEKIKLNKKVTVANKFKELPKDSPGSRDQNKSKTDSNIKEKNESTEILGD